MILNRFIHMVLPRIAYIINRCTATVLEETELQNK
jgi:hypothetical protein